MIDELLNSCQKLPKISPEAADAYIRAIDTLVDQVNSQLETNPHIGELIGRNPLDVMRDNHKNHATFMSAVFKINSFELLARTVPWVYRAYHARGFSYDYFPVELVAWQIALHECLENPGQKAEILTVYNWMVQQHDVMIKLSLSGEGLSFAIQREANEMHQVFLSLLLHGDSRGCLTLAEQSILNAADLKLFYLDVIWPALTRIGQMWEANQISIAEEHLATAIVGRAMASLYQHVAQSTVTRGKAVVSAAPNEFHEVGARMVADFMEMDGWDVTYLGANTPAHEILGLLKKHQPFVAALSVATVYNLDNAQQVIRMLNEDRETSHIKIMVGGLAFNNVPELWQTIGADGYAADAESAVQVTGDWWDTREI